MPPYSDNDDRPLLYDGPNEEEEEDSTTATGPWRDVESRGRSNSIPNASTASSDDIHIRSVSPQPMESTSTLQLPIWLREAAPSFRWHWVPLRVRKAARFANEWTKGPKSPQIQRIQPWFPSVQELPLRGVRALLPRRWQKGAALLLLYFAWALTFSLVIRDSARSGDIEDYGVPANLWCGANLWSGAKGCGLDGNNCRPFTNASFAFRCNANCAGLHVLSPYPVGDEEALYTPFVVGGPPSNDSEIPGIYRSDSFICQAAVHSGIVSNAVGGCGIVHLAGAQASFPATYSHGISSYEFPSYFPKSYTLEAVDDSQCGVVDMRWPLLGVTLGFTIVISLFTSSPVVFFWSMFTMIFLHVGFVSDKPNIASYQDLFSVMVSRFLPAAFTAFPLYLYAARPQLWGLTAQVEKTVLWLGGMWVGALTNYTFEFIPISRLTPEDMRQPGAVLALVLICVLLFLIACGQVYYLRLEARLRTYLVVYGLMVSFLLICVALPTHHLRIHHYVLALLLTPGTRPQTRPGLLYQGILMGLFVNGTARWGFGSILETAAALRVSGPDGPQLDSLLPNVSVVVGWDAAKEVARNLSFSWPGTPPPGYDGVSVVVNDVERHRWYVGEGAPAWTYVGGQGHGRWWGGGRQRKSPEFFRFGFMSGSAVQDYSKAGVWQTNGTWSHMDEGAS